MTSVYFVEAPGFDLVKIGFAKSVEKRMADLRYAAPTGLALLKTLPGGRREERALHKRFHEHRTHGEWFKLSPIRAAIDALGGTVELLSERLACVDCGAIRSEHSRARAKRCRVCAGKARTASLVPRVPAEVRCLACERTVAASNLSGLCRPCGMRKAWASDSYQATILAARARRRRKCKRCGEALESRRASYHPACWEATDGEQRRESLGQVCGSTRERSEEPEQ
jgi:hypothetical protein